MPGTSLWIPLASHWTILDSGVHASRTGESVAFTGGVVVWAAGEGVVVLVVVGVVVVDVVVEVVVVLMVALAGMMRMSAQLKYCS